MFSCLSYSFSSITIISSIQKNNINKQEEEVEQRKNRKIRR
jgi:hypothetical protein